MPKLKVLATVVHLLATTLIRVGNEEYARTNGSFGLTTLCNRHIKVEGSTVHFAFRGKSGVRHRIDINDARLARIVHKCRDLPGHELFQYLDEEGAQCSIDSADVNEYLREAVGQAFTAKDFRTWAATVLAAQALRDTATFESQVEAKRNVVLAIESMAKRLGNRTSVCRTSYIHPAVVEAYLDGSLVDSLCVKCSEIASLPLNPEEKAVLGFL